MKALRHNKGFTVIEMAVVIILTLTIILPLAYSLQRSLKTSNEVYRLNTASFLAQQKIEEVRARASCYSTHATERCEPNTNYYNFPFDFSEAPPCNFPVPFQDFECEVIYVEPTNGVGKYPNHFREIQVRVWYDENNNDIWDAIESDVLLQTGLTEHPPIWR